MPSRQKVTFASTSGESLAGALMLPDRPKPKAVVLFAHCFTCGKSNAAASRISRSLCAKGFAVLRFDFTGLGDSSGDFANAGFASNIEDLVAAAAYLREGIGAPTLLVGHSLGGTAVLAAADRIPEVRAVATVGSPAAPTHTLSRFTDGTPNSAGNYQFDIAGRAFEVSARFADAYDEQEMLAKVRGLRRALLVLHAPFDEVVSVDQASALFAAAMHPKSFVSLDGADHLLSRLADAQYVAETITAWASRYLKSENEARPDVVGGHIQVAEGNQRFLRQVNSDDHAWLSDEPKSMGGDNLGPDPYEHLLAALGTCTSMTLRMYANRKSLPLEDVTVTLSHHREHAKDCESCPDKDRLVDVIERQIELQGPLSDAQRQRLLQIADRCPVHRTLENDIEIKSELVVSDR